MTQSKEIHHTIEQARSRWLEASERASQLASDLFQPGNGYGDPDARAADEHRLQSAKHDADRLFQEYSDLDRREMELCMLSHKKRFRYLHHDILTAKQRWHVGIRLCSTLKFAILVNYALSFPRLTKWGIG